LAGGSECNLLEGRQAAFANGLDRLDAGDAELWKPDACGLGGSLKNLCCRPPYCGLYEGQSFRFGEAALNQKWVAAQSKYAEAPSDDIRRLRGTT
jgi:hypothetical protein